MITEFNRLFLKYVEKLPNKTSKIKVAAAIEAVEAAANLAAIPGVKKLTNYRNAYRIWVGDFQIGFFEKDGIIEFSRVLNRRDMYRQFP